MSNSHRMVRYPGSDCDRYEDATLTRSCFPQKHIGARASPSKLSGVYGLLTLTTRDSP
jgi:hypothetical protein